VSEKFVVYVWIKEVGRRLKERTEENDLNILKISTFYEYFPSLSSPLFLSSSILNIPLDNCC
jgi:hypothetical protein